jgi:D-tyrosyl-tRNA(Tyr) deacylase
MKAIIQRVHSSSVIINDAIHASISRGMTILIGYCQGDDASKNEWLVEKLLGLRIYPDEHGKMNHSICDINGGILIIPNFTLCAQTSKGMRPSFVQAEDPQKAKILFNDLIMRLQARHHDIHSGVFGADMNVRIENDGPVTLILEK